ncbi:concanavalin a-like lectins glucanase protein [Rutstroemia sp. NJR-2017a WRK4]|nr:concanavalin a-like lectins glucanase protein [Rutstroemia sp. NJR-2017a WRK4]
MGMTHSTARYVAPASFLIDFAAQQYGMLSTPNMKDVHDANLSFWSPQPYAIALFFFPQQIFQLVWLYRLWKLDPKKSEKERRETEIMTDFVPFYALGNLCIAFWMIFWNASSLKTANIFVLINSFTQLYYIFGRLSPMNTKSTSSMLTHVVAKTFAGIGVLDLLHNGSVAYFDHQGPNTMVKVLTGVGFGAVASMSDWIFGGCLVYDLVALAVGQRQIGESGWSNLLGVYALGTAGLVGLRNWARPPYVKEDVEGYEVAPGEEEV